LLQKIPVAAPLTPVQPSSLAEIAPVDARAVTMGTSPPNPAAVPSFDEVFAEHAPFVWRALRRLGVPEGDVEDVAQEVFLVVHRRLPTFEGQSAVRTWVYGICLRVASDYRRRPHRAREQAIEDSPEPAIPADQDAAVDRRRALAWLDGVLDGLDEAKRAVFVLFEIEGVPMAEVAAAAGCPVQTAYARLYAARKHVEAAARREQARRSSR
jgi:RNA polymerase sigma-70 factor, ECF subfamily